MSSSNISSVTSNQSIIEKAIFHAQRLRNRMAEAIIANNNFCSDSEVKHNNSPASEDDGVARVAFSRKKYNKLSPQEHAKIDAYLKGNFMPKEDELNTMELLKSLSASDLCRATDDAYCSLHNRCMCAICKAFHEDNLKCDIKRTSDKSVMYESNNVDPVNSFISEVKDKFHSYQYEVLKYIDCMKVCVHSVYLTDVALQRLLGLSSAKKNPISASANTYFLEYKIPEFIKRKSVKPKSKLNTGLNDADLIRMCSRQMEDGAIYFKHIEVHDICNLQKFNLEEIDITFQLSCRTPRQKHSNILGCASFNLDLLAVSKNLTSSRELIIKLKENTPVVVGSIKVSFQLGCGRLLFGKDFIDTLNANKENSIPLCSDEVSISDSEKILKREREYHSLTKKLRTVKCSPSKKQQTCQTKHIPPTVSQRTVKCSPSKKQQICQTEDIPPTASQANKEYSHRNAEVQTENLHPESIYTIVQENEKCVLFGFLYISQAQFLTKPLNSYFICRLFGQHEASESRLIDNTSNPVFNFYQVIPLVYEDSLLKTLQNNFMVIEIFEKLRSRDIIIGVANLSLHQFYIAYKNPVVVKYLNKNKLPIIGTDWWEPVTIPLTNEVVGQIQVLTALGTKEQIGNLELERGLKNSTANANPQYCMKNCVLYSSHIENSHINRNQELIRGFMSESTSSVCVPAKVSETKTQNNIEKPQIQKLDIGIQSDFTMDSKSSERKENSAEDVLDMFLNKLISQKQKNICVENSTNTDDDKVEAIRNTNSGQQGFSNEVHNESNLELRQTSGLLDCLQKALAIDSIPKITNELKRDIFKVRIKIENALHLPTTKKCKSKKSKNRGNKLENILPSTYVTFETTTSNLHVTRICQKSTSPCWNYENTFDLPLEFLINNQKRLIFKVWKKSTNTSMQPNMQTDVVLGFAALDLTVLTTGLPNIQGWFNIVDFSGTVKGQINITITPLENLSKHQLFKETDNFLHKHHVGDTCSDNLHSSELLQEDIVADEPGELLSRALKRKFSELDEITQRLRLRLSKVTNDEADLSNDEFTEEFERDINTLCIEDDFDTVNFEENSANGKSFSQYDLLSTKNCLLEIDTGSSPTESGALSLVSMETTESPSNNNVASPPTDAKINAQNNEMLDTDLILGRQHIEVLLEKLSSLQTNDGNLSVDTHKANNICEKLTTSSADVSTFSNRFVSGCSANTEESESCIDTEAILKELDHSSRPNIHSCSKYDPSVFEQIYSDDSNNSATGSNKSSSETSIFTSCSRVEPDGAGASSDGKIKASAGT